MVKKQLIMEKALELFAEQGYEATSIQQITDSCGISKGAFYLSFKSKDELILGLIDHFMHDFLTNIERSVSQSVQSERLVYNYLYQSFSFFREHANFAHTFMKEYQTTMNEGVFEKIEYYDRIFNQLVYDIVIRQFPKTKEQDALELMFIVQAFLQRYSQLFLKGEVSPIDLDLLCSSIVEKVAIIAEHSTIKYFSPEWVGLGTEHSKEELLRSMEDKLSVLSDGILKESLQLLYSHLRTPSLPQAIEAGLILNLRNDPQTKWLAELYKSINT